MKKLIDQDKLKKRNPLSKPGQSIAQRISKGIDKIADIIFD